MNVSFCSSPMKGMEFDKMIELEDSMNPQDKKKNSEEIICDERKTYTSGE